MTLQYIAYVTVILTVGSGYVRVKLRPPMTPLYILSLWTHVYGLLVERELTWGTESWGKKKNVYAVPVCPLQFPYEMAGHPLRKAGV